MGQGTSSPITPPTTAPAAAPATAATPTSTATLTEGQKMALSMMLSQMNKGQQSMPSMQQQTMSGQPTTQTIAGGTVINPQQR